MRRMKLSLLLCISALAAWPTHADAQFLGGNVGLLLSKEARDQLGMDANQTERTMSLIDETKVKMKAAFQGLSDLPASRRQEAMLERVRAVNDHSKEILATILKPEQMLRYEQFELWTSSVTALTDPRVQDALKLDADQRAKLRDFSAEFLKARAEAIGQRLPVAKIQEIEDAEMDRAMSVMTDEQRAKWNAMRGERPTF